MGLIIGIGLVGFALFGGALFVLLGGASIIGYLTAGEPISTILIDFNRLTRNSTILIIPLFTFAGYIIAEGTRPAVDCVCACQCRMVTRWNRCSRPRDLCFLHNFYRRVRGNDYRPRRIAISDPTPDV